MLTINQNFCKGYYPFSMQRGFFTKSVFQTMIFPTYKMQTNKTELFSVFCNFPSAYAPPKKKFQNKQRNQIVLIVQEKQFFVT